MNSNQEEHSAVSIVNEINIRCRKQTKPFYTRYYLTADERRQIIKDVGDSACLLFEYYLRMASVGDQEISDTAAAEYFGWNTHKAKRHRLALTRAGWFRSVRCSYSDGRKGINYYIGEDAVMTSGA